MERLDYYEFDFSEGNVALYIDNGEVCEFLFPSDDSFKEHDGAVGHSLWKRGATGSYLTRTPAQVTMTRWEFFEILQIAYKVWLNENPE